MALLNRRYNVFSITTLVAGLATGLALAEANAHGFGRVSLGRELINGASGGLPESALEPRAALGRRKWHFRKVPITDIVARMSARLLPAHLVATFLSEERTDPFKEPAATAWCPGEDSVLPVEISGEGQHQRIGAGAGDHAVGQSHHAVSRPRRQSDHVLFAA
jgi:hypothetical protein